MIRCRIFQDGTQGLLRATDAIDSAKSLPARITRFAPDSSVLFIDTSPPNLNTNPTELPVLQRFFLRCARIGSGVEHLQIVQRDGILRFILEYGAEERGCFAGSAFLEREYPHV